MGYITNYDGLDANRYNGNNDFRGFLAANGYGKFLPYVGNDGKGDFRKMENKRWISRQNWDKGFKISVKAKD